MLILLIICIAALLFLIYQFIRRPARTPAAKRIRLIITLVLVATIVVISLIEFGPRGINSLFAKAGFGENKGSDMKQSYADAEDARSSPSDTPVGQDVGGGSLPDMTIRGNTVYIGTESFEDIGLNSNVEDGSGKEKTSGHLSGRGQEEVLMERLKSLKPAGKTVYIWDDYAASSTWHFVEDFLREQGAHIYEKDKDN